MNFNTSLSNNTEFDSDTNVTHLTRPSGTLIKKPIVSKYKASSLLLTVVSSVYQAATGTLTNSHCKTIALKYYNELIKEFLSKEKALSEFINNNTILVYPKDFKKILRDTLIAGGRTVTTDNTLQLRDFTDFDFIIKVNNTSSGIKLKDFLDYTFFGEYSGFYIISGNLLFNALSSGDFDTNLLANIDTTQQRDSKTISNSDIFSISVIRSAFGNSVATVSIKNANRKYCFTQGVNKGNCLFSPMDEIKIYLPTRQGQLNTAFTGYINAVSDDNESGFNSIVLSCECRLKSLRLDRLNMHPSLSAIENEGNSLQAFALPKEFYETPEQYIPYIIAKAASNMFCQLDLDTIATGTVDVLLSYLWYTRFNRTSNADVSRALDSYKTLTSLYVVTRTGTAISTPGNNDTYRLDVTETKFTPYNINDMSPSKTVYYVVYKERRDVKIPIVDDKNKIKTADCKKTMVGLFYGTAWQLYKLSLATSDFQVSNWQTSLNVLMDAAAKLYWSYYTTSTGVIRIGPPKTSLTSLKFVQRTDDKNNVTYNYLNNANRIKDFSSDSDTATNPNIFFDQFIVRDSLAEDDTHLINWVVGKGDTTIPIEGFDSFGGNIYRDDRLFNKFGMRMGNELLVTSQSPKLMSWIIPGIIQRNNLDYTKNTVTIMGDSSIDIDDVFYIPRHNKIFYISAVQSSFTSGGSYQQAVTGSWGRRALLNTPFVEGNEAELTKQMTSYDADTQNSDVEISTAITPKQFKDDFKNILGALWVTGKIPCITYKKYLTFYNKKLSSTDTINWLSVNCVFNGYLWEDVALSTYEDLVLFLGEEPKNDIVNKNLYANLINTYGAYWAPPKVPAKNLLNTSGSILNSINTDLNRATAIDYNFSYPKNLNTSSSFVPLLLNIYNNRAAIIDLYQSDADKFKALTGSIDLTKYIDYLPMD